MKKTCISGLIVLLALSGWNVRGETYDVGQFGAKGDGQTLDTAAIQKALDQCKENGGTVVLPAGTYLSRPLTMHDRTVLQINRGATLVATDIDADYLIPGTTNAYRAFIEGQGPTSLKLTGGGTIEGSGGRWWRLAEEARRMGRNPPRPYLVHFTNCASVYVGGITLQNSARFHFVPDLCDNVLVENVRIFSPTNATTTEGITAGLCRNMTVRNCFIEVTSDNVDFKSDLKLKGREFGCENLLVENCVIRRGRGVCVGSETRGGVRNVIVRNCVFTDSENGVRIKSTRGRGGVVENVVFENNVMTNVVGAITIAEYYPAVPQLDTNQPMTDLTPRFSNIFITNLTATSSTWAAMIVGLPESHIKNVVLQNVRIDAAGKGFLIRDADNVVLKNVHINAAQGPSFLVKNAQVHGLPGPTGVLVTNINGVVRVEINGQLFTEYHYQGASKPYCYPIIGPTYDGMTRDWPMKETTPGEEHDHVHQRGFWIGHGDVNGVDIWGEQGTNTGKIIHAGFEQIKSGRDSGVIKTRNQWVDASGKVICTDEQKLTFYNPGEAWERMFDFEITFHATNGSAVTLGDTKEGMLAFRLAESMRLTRPAPGGGQKIPGKGHISNDSGLQDAAVWGQPAKWIDYYGPVNGQMVGVAIFDHPTNLRHPTTWHARDYGLMAANPFGLHDFLGKKVGEGDYTIPQGQSLTLRYRVYIHEGDTQQGKVAEQYKAYLTSPGK